MVVCVLARLRILVCVCVCMYVLCVYVCMSVCMSVRMYVCMALLRPKSLVSRSLRVYSSGRL